MTGGLLHWSLLNYRPLWTAEHDSLICIEHGIVEWVQNGYSQVVLPFLSYSLFWDGSTCPGHTSSFHHQCCPLCYSVNECGLSRVDDVFGDHKCHGSGCPTHVQGFVPSYWLFFFPRYVRFLYTIDARAQLQPGSAAFWSYEWHCMLSKWTEKQLLDLCCCVQEISNRTSSLSLCSFLVIQFTALTLFTTPKAIRQWPTSCQWPVTRRPTLPFTYTTLNHHSFGTSPSNPHRLPLTPLEYRMYWLDSAHDSLRRVIWGWSGPAVKWNDILLNCLPKMCA